MSVQRLWGDLVWHLWYGRKVGGLLAVPLGTELVCDVCGSDFVKEANTQKYCKSVECKKQRQKNRWQKWYAREDSKVKSRTWQREFRGRTNYARAWEVKNKYGLEWDEYLVLMEKFGHQCPVCGSKEQLCVDHDHVTGRVRGVLCRTCNRSLGQLGDTVERVEKLYHYLRDNSA
jgi:hypothetical protein